MYLFRIHIRPGGGKADKETTFAYCLKHRFLGVGWRVEGLANTKEWGVYEKAARQVFDSFQGCSYIQKWVSVGDLVWTRDTFAQYFLARVTAPWEYWYCPAAAKADIDIANVFRCDIRPVPIDSVPGKVIAGFRARRTIQEVASSSALEYSKYLWNEIAGKSVYAIDVELCRDLFMLLDDQETEDAVFLYLQSLGWHVLPNSRQSDTMAFEYLLVRPNTGEIAAAQVKTGNTWLHMSEYAGYDHKVFLFQAGDQYVPAPVENVTCIKRDTLYRFLKKSESWLPGYLKKKLVLSQTIGSDL